MVEEDRYLASNREDWLSWLGDTSRDACNDHVDRDGQEGGQDRGKGVLGTTILWHLDELLNGPANKIIPAESGSEREARDNSVERLGFQFLSNEFDSINGLFEHGGHGKFYNIYRENFLFW